jgi:hypothetical protein
VDLPTQKACATCAVESCPSRNPDGNPSDCDDPDQAGGRLARAAIVTFLLPLACALAASACVPGGEAARIGAAFLGLAIGITFASLVQRRRATA